MYITQVYQARIDKAKQELDELLKRKQTGDRIYQLRNRIRNLEELKKRFK